MAKRTYYQGGRIDYWQGMDKSWCVQAIHRDNEVLTKAGYNSQREAIKAGKEALDKAITFSNHIFKI